MPIVFTSGALGLPYHGRVFNGKIDLPGARSMDYPQPTPGATYEVRRPGWTAPDRTPEEQADDAAKGYEWRDYALVSGRLGSDGGGLHLGGKNLGGWIFFDEENEPWLARVARYGNINHAYEMELSFRRFGVLSGKKPAEASDEWAHTTDPIDLEQQSPVLSNSGGGEIPATVVGPDYPLKHILLDFTADGRRALWGAYAVEPRGYIDLMAVYEIQIGAGRAVTIELLAGRGECVVYKAESDDVSYCTFFHETGFPTGGDGPGIYETSLMLTSTSSPLGALVDPGTRRYSIPDQNNGVGDYIYYSPRRVPATDMDYGYAGHSSGASSVLSRRAVGARYSNGSPSILFYESEWARELSGSHSIDLIRDKSEFELLTSSPWRWQWNSPRIEFSYESRQLEVIDIAIRITEGDAILAEERMRSVTEWSATAPSVVMPNTPGDTVFADFYVTEESESEREGQVVHSTSESENVRIGFHPSYGAPAIGGWANTISWPHYRFSPGALSARLFFDEVSITISGLQTLRSRFQPVSYTAVDVGTVESKEDGMVYSSSVQARSGVVSGPDPIPGESLLVWALESGGGSTPSGESEFYLLDDPNENPPPVAWA